MLYPHVYQADPQLHAAMLDELHRQQNKLEMIASENFVDEAVMEAQGSILTNKYAEGYPGKRYYGGCEFVDVAESLARERALELFGAEHVNVQPHSGAQANAAVFFALLQPGDKILGMDLAHGGHLTHGMKKNLSGAYFEAEGYQVDPETARIDYEALYKKAMEYRPKMIIAGASAYPRTIDFARFGEIARACGALLMVDMAHIAGLVAAGLHPSPIPYADVVTTTTHKTLRGPRGGMIFCKEEWAKKIDSAVFPGTQGGPLMHVIAAKAVAFGAALKPEFKQYQQAVLDNAQALAQGLLDEGFSLVSGGTDNHLLLVDLRNSEMTGKVLQERLDAVNITCNKNGVPYDTRKPTITSGIRLGTPALTSRGLGTAEMKRIAHCIARAASDDFESQADSIRAEVAEICQAFPLYADLEA